MRLGYHRRRLATVASGLKLAKQLDAQLQEPEPALRARQQAPLDALVRHAREHSPFYRERLPDGPVALDRLPVLEKPKLMERFDEIVTTAACTATSCSRGSRAAGVTSCSTAPTA